MKLLFLSIAKAARPLMFTLFVAVATCLTPAVQAALITVEQDKTHYQVGETIVSKLYLSDFHGPLTAALLSFSLGSQLSLQQWQISDAFDDGAGDYRFGDLIAGQLFLEAYADWAASLAVLAQKQQDRFLLATVSTKALSGGQFSFQFDPLYSSVLDSNGQLAHVSVQQRGFLVSSVSTPWSVPLLLSGVLLLWWRRFA